ncbi:hypothetical protein [Pseudactinotalea sp.]|uniref:hypothetical protein n=1 Tax=Pseudactinotalea sp. TaxID=1926260 RepID=UPI003B3A616A
MRNGATGGRWSSPFVVRALGLLVALAVAAAGFLTAAAVLDGGSTELPMEHGFERREHGTDALRGTTGERTPQGSW